MSRWGRAGLLAGFITLVSLAGCTSLAWFYPTAVPMRTCAYPASAAAGPVDERTLLVLLPGRGDDGDAFAQHGFIDDVRRSGAPIDMVTVDANLGYYMKSTISERVWTDVVAPARARGYRHIWMAGVSMGGLGSLSAALEHPGAIEGLILIAPYLGTDRVLSEIARQGGADRWSADDPTDAYQQLWTWLKKYRERDPTEKMPQIVLAYGKQDRLGAGHRLLAALLKPEEVTVIQGSHDWGTWKKLWSGLWSPTGTRALALARR